MGIGSSPPSAETHVLIRPLRAADLSAADRVRRLAFGTFLGLADPLSFAAWEPFPARGHSEVLAGNPRGLGAPERAHCVPFNEHRCEGAEDECPERCAEPKEREG